LKLSFSVKLMLGLLMTIFYYSPAFAATDRDSLKIGDTLSVYMLKYLVKYEYPLGDISNWQEGKNITALTYAKKTDAKIPAILMTSTKIPFGAVQGKASNAYFLFDTDGDAALDYRTTKPLLPIWLVLHDSKIIDEKDSIPKKYLDLLYATFQADSGPSAPEKVKTAVSMFCDYYNDTTKPNRDLMYLFNYYINFTDKPQQALIAMHAVEEKYGQRYKTIHPAILLFLLESNINDANVSEANIYNKRLLSVDPTSIPGMYYQWQLMESSAAKDTLGKELKTRYPHHWLISKIK